MAESLIFVGHVSIDHVENVNGTNIQPGGAALYASLAAKTLSPNVTLISAVGHDFSFSDVFTHLNIREVKKYNSPSTRFHIHYDENWNANYVNSSHGVGNKVTSRSIPNSLLLTKNTFHISPMRASKVDRIFTKIKRHSPESTISINTWIDYIKEGRKSRKTLTKLASQADFFILNDVEVKALTNVESISTAIELLNGKMLIVTLGSLGAIISGETIGKQMIPALNLSPEKIVDTTGAGDVWCGAFLATYNSTKDFTKSVSVASIISRIKCSNWGFRNLLDLRFKEPDDVIDFVIGMREGSLQRRISDFLHSKS